MERFICEGIYRVIENFIKRSTFIFCIILWGFFSLNVEFLLCSIISNEDATFSFGSCLAQQLRAPKGNEAVIAGLMKSFEAESKRARPDFEALKNIFSRMVELDEKQAELVDQRIQQTAKRVVTDVLEKIEKAMNEGGIVAAQTEIAYCNKYREYLNIPFEKMVALEEKARELEKALKIMETIDADIAKIVTMLNQNNIGESRAAAFQVQARLEAISKSVSTAIQKEYLNKISGIQKAVDIKEDSLVSVCLRILNTEGKQAAVAYMEQVLRRYRISDKQFEKIDREIVNYEIRARQRADSIRAAERERQYQAQLEMERLERQRQEQIKAEQEAEKRRKAQEEKERQHQAMLERQRQEKEQKELQRRQKEMEKLSLAEQQRKKKEEEQRLKAIEKAEKARLKAEEEERRRRAELEEQRRLEQEQIQKRLQKQKEQALIASRQQEELRKQQEQQRHSEIEKKQQQEQQLQRGDKSDVPQHKQQPKETSNKDIVFSIQQPNSQAKSLPAESRHQHQSYKIEDSALNYQRAQNKIMRIYELIEQGKTKEAIALFQSEQNMLKQFTEREVFETLNSILSQMSKSTTPSHVASRQSASASSASSYSGVQSGIVSSSPNPNVPERKPIIRSREEAVEYSRQIYNFMEKNKVKEAYKAFQDASAMLKKYLDDTEYSMLESIVFRAYGNLDPSKQ